MAGGKKKKPGHRRHKKNKNKKENDVEKPLNTEEPADQFGDEDQELAGDFQGDSERIASKRAHDDDDTDVEDKPERKKKKKPKIQVQSTEGNKKGKKSIRQMKREKYLQRQAEAEAAQKNELKSECLTYISQWEHDRSSWKFMKAKQVWLTKNKFSASLVPDASWPILLKYFESAKGNVRTTLLGDANKVIKQMDEWTEKNGATKEAAEDDEDVETDITKPKETAYKRARDLIQCLQE